MLGPLLIGSLIIIFNMGLQCLAVVVMIKILLRHYPFNNVAPTFAFKYKILSIVLAVLFVGHILQSMVWAGFFLFLAEFDSFTTSFYHSIVNFASLGYGDIVMSEKWRLLGALEACNGVLMFGLTTGTLLTIMVNLFKPYQSNTEVQK